jgi:hypothetical protein
MLLLVHSCLYGAEPQDSMIAAQIGASSPRLAPTKNQK